VVSSRHETGPLVVLEAASVGVPTVGTSVGHIVEWSPFAAIAVAVGDSNALASSILSVIDDESLRLRMAHEAMSRARLEDADHTAARFEALYAQLIDSE
jgi:glycosyltransferase involved in cell wall biosynthesis